MPPSTAFLLTCALLSAAVVAIQDGATRRQLWSTPKYTPSISSSYSDTPSSGGKEESSTETPPPVYYYSSSSSNDLRSSSGGMKEAEDSSDTTHFDTLEQYAVAKESYDPPSPEKPPHNNNYNGSGVQSYGGPDLTLQSRPVVYTPPHVTFHPPQIIVSEAGVVFTDPHTTYSHHLPSGGGDGGQMIAYQPVQLSSSYNPHNVRVSYPQLPQGSTYAQPPQGYSPQGYPPQGYPQGYRQQLYPQPQQPQMSYPQYTQYPQYPQTRQGVQEQTYSYRQPQRQQEERRQTEEPYVPRGSPPLQPKGAANVDVVNKADAGQIRHKRGQPPSTNGHAPPKAAPHGRWPISMLMLPTNKKT